MPRTISLLPFILFVTEALIASICSYVYGDSNGPLKFLFACLLAGNAVTAGMLHFSKSMHKFYTSMIFVPFKTFWLFATGAVLVFAGIGLLWAKTQVIAARALVGVFIIMFPGNIACVFCERPRRIVCGGSMTTAILRLPVQFLFIAWANWYT